MFCFSRRFKEDFCKTCFEDVRSSLRRSSIKEKFSTFLKKRLCHRCFPVNFVKFSRTPFFTEHLWSTASDIFKTYLKDVLETNKKFTGRNVYLYLTNLNLHLTNLYLANLRLANIRQIQDVLTRTQ